MKYTLGMFPFTFQFSSKVFLFIFVLIIKVNEVLPICLRTGLIAAIDEKDS